MSIPFSQESSHASEAEPQKDARTETAAASAAGDDADAERTAEASPIRRSSPPSSPPAPARPEPKQRRGPDRIAVVLLLLLLVSVAMNVVQARPGPGRRATRSADHPCARRRRRALGRGHGDADGARTDRGPAAGPGRARLRDPSLSFSILRRKLAFAAACSAQCASRFTSAPHWLPESTLFRSKKLAPELYGGCPTPVTLEPMEFLRSIAPRQLAFALLVTAVAVGIPTESCLIALDFDALTALPFAVLATLVSAGLFY